MGSLAIDIIKTARPRQWVKNLTLYAALLFTGYIFTPEVLVRDFWLVTEAVVAFTLVAASIYYVNDMVDMKADQAHPFKRKRPIPAGRISRTVAVVAFGIFLSSGLAISFNLSELFGLTVLGYCALQIAYSFWLKNVEVLDVFVIAMGFFLRVIAGAVVINAHLSSWFLLCVISVSVFLAVGKRRAEMAILTEQGAISHRKVMGKYSANILDAYLAMFATAAFLSWSLYTFNFYDQPGNINSLLTPIGGIRTFTIDKWLMATIPVVIFGIMRYIRIIYDGSRAETPERVILSDYPLLGAVGVWAMLVVLVLYTGTG